MSAAIVIEDCNGVVANDNTALNYDHVIVARRSTNLELSRNQALRSFKSGEAEKSPPLRMGLRPKAMLWITVSLIALLADLKTLLPFW